MVIVFFNISGIRNRDRNGRFEGFARAQGVKLRL